MARPLRLEHEGALWHVTSRGNERRTIFRDASDRRAFLRVLGEVVVLAQWRLHAYVLMGNHYHLLVETPRPNLSAGMHRVNAVYSQRFNRRHERVGHLLQGRFKAILVERERHLLELVRYVVLNPVRAGLVDDPAGWLWSNYRATAGLGPSPAWLDVGWTLAQFGVEPHARTAYQEFVLAGRVVPDKPWSKITGQLFLGSDEFRRQLHERFSGSALSREIPSAQRRATRAALSEVVRASADVLGVDPITLRARSRTPLRLAVTYVGRQDSMARLVELGELLGVSVSTVHEMWASARRLKIHEPAFRNLLRRVRRELRKIET